MRDLDRPSGRDAPHIVQLLLRVGLAAATVMVTAGLGWALATGRETSLPVGLGALLADAEAPDRLMAGGILVLALTPVARVVALLVLWWRERDWTFVAVGFAVVVVLVAAIVLGHA
jgi:hypothetical protein